MEKLAHVFGLLALATGIAASGCVGSDGGHGGIDGGGGFTGGTSGGTSGVGGGVCFQCAENCFDCGRGCIECSFPPDGSIGRDEDGGVIPFPWTSPFTNSGEDGTWRSTGDNTLCMQGMSLDALSVWSDDRGVYVLGNGQFPESVFLGSGGVGGGNSGAAPPIFDAGFSGAGGGGGGAGFAGVGGVGGIGGFGGGGGTGAIGGMGGGEGECFQGSFQCAGRVIYFNDGVSGWRQQHKVSQYQDGWTMRFSGVPAGDLVIHRLGGGFGSDCTLRMIDGATERCEHSGSAVESFFAVNAQLAYATIGTNLLVFDGALWSVHPAPLTFVPTALWANETDVVAVGDLGRIARLRDGAWTAQNRGIQYLTSVWGGVGDELWVGTGSSDIMHRDASGVWTDTFNMRGVSCTRSDPILGIWGADGTVYFHTDRALARWDGSRFTSVNSWTCAVADVNFGEVTRTIKNIWGNGPNELFIAVSDVSRSADPFGDVCGNGFVVYFDGSRFHRL